jgi:hypothetical protein
MGDNCHACKIKAMNLLEGGQDLERGVGSLEGGLSVSRGSPIY